MSRPLHLSAALTLALVAGGFAAACGSDAKPATPAENPAAAATASANAAVTLARENVTTVQKGRISAGPTVSGQFTPAREATVRSQVGGSVVELPIDRGQPVQAGQVIARISSRDLRDSYASAEAAVKSAETALKVAQSELQRTEALAKGGALAARDVDQARNAVSGSEAQLAAAKARERSVWQLLDDTTIKAPFAGIVSARPASVGDVVTPGAQLLTIIDPSSLRLEAFVPAEQAMQLKRGAPVRFRVRGLDEPLMGRVDRLNAIADPVTRQVAVFVTVPNVGGRLIGGMFAEGRVETTAREALVVPLAAVDETGAVPVVTRIKDAKAERVEVTIGARQPDIERVEIIKGLAEGDVVALGSARGIPSGSAVRIAD